MSTPAGEAETTAADGGSSPWPYVMMAAIVAWLVIGFALEFALVLQGSALVAVGAVLLFAWLALPIAVYFDAPFVAARSDWAPNRFIWVLLLSVWVVNVPAAALYLYRRWTEL